MATILVVDDSNLSRKTSRRLLEMNGHQVIDASDGLSALERFVVDHPDMVLLDVTMPGMSGLEVLKQIRSLNSAARVVMATADVQASTREIATAEGAVGFVTKPLAVDALIEAIKVALEGVVP